MDFKFTPEFQRTLASMGIDFNKLRVNMDANLAQSQGWKESKIDMSAPYFKLRASGIDPGIHHITDPRVTSQIQRKGGIVTPEVQKLYDSVLKMRDEEAARGAPSTAPKKGWFTKTLDIISRPGRGVTTGIHEDLLKNPDGGFFRYKDFVRGFGAGFTGKESKTGTDILRDSFGVKNRVGLFAGGLGIDIATDPLSYLGFGVAKKAVDLGGKVAKTRSASESVLSGIGKAPLNKGAKVPDLDTLSRVLGSDITAGKVLSPTGKTRFIGAALPQIDSLTSVLGAQAGKAAQLSIADDLTHLGFSSSDALKSASKWLNPKYAKDPAVQSEKSLFSQLIKTLPDMKSIKHLDTTFAKLFTETKDTATKQLTEVLNANLEQQIRKAVTVKGYGLELPVLPIPNTAIKVLSGVAKAPLLDKAIAGFNKTFNTGSKFDHELYITKSRAAGKAEQRINLGQQRLVKAFQGIGKDRRIGYMRALTASPANYGRGVLQLADGTDMGDMAYDMFSHFGQYIDWTGKGAGIISLQKLNSYLPHKYRFDTSTLRQGIFNPVPQKGAQNFLNIINYQKEHFANVDPQDLLYHLHIGIEKSLARDQFLRAISDMGVPYKASQLTKNPTMAAATKQGNTAASKLVSEHGYVPIYTKTTREIEADIDPSYERYLKDRVFHPDIKAGLVHMLRIMDDEKAVTGLAKTYDRALGYFKKIVTLPNPGYHIRNSFGDMLTSYTDGVQGARGMASYAQAAKVLRMINPLSKQEEVQKILTQAVDTSGNIQDPLQEIARLLGGRKSISGNLVMKKNPKWKDIPGQYVSAEQFMAAYQHTGLKRGFVATDLERELRGNPNILMQGMHLPIDLVLKASQQREDYFRLAHFIDRIKRSRATTFEEAAKEAAYYVKKFHFDYSDVTPTERALFSRAIPFYKFQRFATPLMLQMFFANPGKLLNAQKVLNNLSTSGGYETDGFLPTADMIIPEYMRDAMLLPLYQTSKNSTAFFSNSILPSTSIFSQTLGGESSSPRGTLGSMGQNIAQSLTPAAQIPAELYYGKRILGKGQIPVQNKEGSYLPYLMSKTPVSNIGFNKMQSADKQTAFINFLTGLGISENTPARQQSELYRERDVITKHRQQSGYKKPKNTSNIHKYISPKLPGR